MAVDRATGPDVADRAVLEPSELRPTWHEQLAAWLADATDAGLPEPNAMVLATVGTDQTPSTRTVLCKDLGERGVVFYTNYTSAKSRDLRSNRHASVTFPWYGLQRQVHIRGTVSQVTREETAGYWATRPRGSQLGAWASPQSVVLSARRVLDDSLRAITQRFADSAEVPVPPHWGGWLLAPETVEFWQGRRDRLHDRLVFRHTDDRRWVVRRLAP
jgi:pyridoxamine 5'-phosphate oxidase